MENRVKADTCDADNRLTGLLRPLPSSERNRRDSRENKGFRRTAGDSSGQAHHEVHEIHPKFSRSGGASKLDARAGPASPASRALRSLSHLTPVQLASLKRRLEATTEPDPETGCLLWRGAKSDAGYGRMRVGDKLPGAHRVAWLLAHGDIPPRLILDHLCRRPACCNIGHLELVSYSENNLRGLAGVLRKRRCKHGHDLTDEASRTSWGRCRICLDAYEVKRRALKRAQRAALRASRREVAR